MNRVEEGKLVATEPTIKRDSECSKQNSNVIHAYQNNNTLEKSGSSTIEIAQNTSNDGFILVIGKKDKRMKKYTELNNKYKLYKKDKRNVG
ncbi:24098_t:CDS:2 [Gigaspora rosea]|nr:24098_t:CDS:2 [Gigaspora rosea]